MKKRCSGRSLLLLFFFFFFPNIYLISSCNISRKLPPRSSPNFQLISFSVEHFSMVLIPPAQEGPIQLGKTSTPKPPSFSSVHTIDHLTRRGFFSRSHLLNIKSLWNFSNLNLTCLPCPFGDVLSLPEGRSFINLFSMPSQTVFDLWCPQWESQVRVEGRAPTLAP